MNWKDSKFYSIFKAKCPRCHEGDMFQTGTLYNPSKFSDMKASCSCCGQVYEPEPGYYYGAMYMSFALSSVIFVLVWLGLALVVEEVTLLMMVIALTVAVVLLLPINFRLSRAMWINMFVGYEGPSKQIPKKKAFRESPAV